jgi:putative FmdB family regulatory protein
MPIYEYRCEVCGHTLEALQKISEEPLKQCPACSESALKRLISAPSFRLKGSGWYETDFKSGKDKKRNLAETAGGGAAEKPAGEKSADGEKAKSTDDKTSNKSDDKPKAATDKKPAKGTGSEAA